MRRLSLTIALLAVLVVGATTTRAYFFGGWPETCLEMNDMVEASDRGSGAVGIYQRAFGSEAEAACQRDHRADIQRSFAWAFDGSVPPAPSRPAPTPTPTPIPDSSNPQIAELSLYVSQQFTNMTGEVTSAAVCADFGDYACAGDFMWEAARYCALALDAIRQIARLSPNPAWDTVAHHTETAWVRYRETAQHLWDGEINAASDALDASTNALVAALAAMPAS